jgi:tRNA-2-methylthio-N6-dimethylallyladenosine synthase
LVFFPQPDEGICIQPGDLVKVQIERTTAWSLQGCALAV